MVVMQQQSKYRNVVYLSNYLYHFLLKDLGKTAPGSVDVPVPTQMLLPRRSGNIYNIINNTSLYVFCRWHIHILENLYIDCNKAYKLKYMFVFLIMFNIF